MIKVWTIIQFLDLFTACGNQKKDNNNDSATAEIEETPSVREMNIPMKEIKNMAKTILEKEEYATLAKWYDQRFNGAHRYGRFIRYFKKSSRCRVLRPGYHNFGYGTEQ
jgi:hypothetical protein